MDNKLLILDGHSLAHRAFYALPILTNTAGEYTNAAYGFTTMLLKLLEEEKPTHIAVAFDMPIPTFRHIEYQEYKAQRKKMPDEMRPQIPLIREIVQSLGIPVVESPGFEADDVIGTLAKSAGGQGTQVYIVTGDRDALQLVDSKISVMLTRKGITDIDLYTPETVKERYGISPNQVSDIKGLMGDTSDNIPGVPGVGEKTATKLLQDFHTVEELLTRIEEAPGKKLKELLRTYSDQAKMSKYLATIVTDVPLEADWHEFKFSPPQIAEIKPLFERLEFRNIIKRIDEGKVSFLQGPKSAGLFDDIKSGDQELNCIGPSDWSVIDEESLQSFIGKLESSETFTLEYCLQGHPMAGELKLLAIRPSEGETYILHKDVLNDIITPLRSFLSSPKHLKIIHDAKTLITYLRSWDVAMQGLIDDTMVAAYLINSTAKGYSLSEITNSYLSASVQEWPAQTGKNRVELGPSESGELAASRINAISQVLPILRKRMEQDELIKLYTDVEVPLVSVLSEMESNGVKVDVSILDELSKELGLRLIELEEDIYRLAGCSFNINSPKQLSEILFVRLGLPAKKKTATGFSTDVEVLEELSEDHEIAYKILEYRGVSKLKYTYADALSGLINARTGRIHTTFNQVATATGRLSSTEPNLQNIPIRSDEGKKIRRVFVPEGETMVLVTADYSQIELRVLAHISGDETLSESFRKGEDIHTRTASEVFGVPLDKVTSLQRSQAKAVNFGIVYGQSGFGLGRGLGIPRKQAQEYIDNYLRRYPGVQAYMKNVVKKAKENGYVVTIYGRRRYIPDIESKRFASRSFAERTAMNTPIQGSAADIIKAAMVKVSNAIKEQKLKSRLILQVHDELVIEAPPEEKEVIKAILKENMENVTKISVPLQVDLKLGSNWRDVTAGD